MACHWKQWRWIWCIEMNGVWEGKVMSLQVMWGTAQERCHTVGSDAFSLCPEQYTEPAAAVRVTTTPRTRLRTCLPVYRPTVPRPDIHKHGSVTSLSSILFSVCSLSTVVIVNTTSHLPFVYSNNKAIGTLFEGLNKEIWLTFLLLLLLVFVVERPQSVHLPSISHCAQIWQALPKNQLLT